MKRFVIFLFLISLIITFTSCKTKDGEPFAIIEEKDCYQNAGYLEFISVAETFAEPILIGDGTISVDEGQYVYIYCSANEFTSIVTDENAKLYITIK